MDIDLRPGESKDAKTVTLGDVRIVFSYRTAIAFYSPATGWVVSENVWGRTTGRHLNQETPVDAVRIPYSEFHQQLVRLVEGFGVS